MNTLKTFVARDLVTRQALLLRIAEGRVLEMASTTEASAPGLWLAPALVDLQVNGFAGVDFQQDDIDLDHLLRAARVLRRSGCARWFATLITDAWEAMIRRLTRLRRLRDQSDDLARAIAGWHLEGPFLSAEPGYHGAHPADRMLNPTEAHLLEVRRITGSDPVVLTLAPEREGALAVIKKAVAMGFTVSLGHTNANAPCLRAAVAAGARGFTHFGNACPQQLDRHDNILWRVLDIPDLTLSLIPDGIHVPGALFRLVHRLRPAGSIFYVSDAMAAAAAPPGTYSLGPLRLEVGADRVVRRPGSPQFAGSALAPVDGIFRAAEMLGECWQETWLRYSTVPARFAGLKSCPRWCLIEVDESGSQPMLMKLEVLEE